MSQEFSDFVIETNFNEYETYDGKEAPLLPVGEYTFRVVNVSQTTGNGKPMIKVESEVVAPESNAGQKAWNNYMLVSRDNVGLKRLKQFMVACGGSLDSFVASEYINATYEGTVIHTESAGKVGPDGNPLPGRSFANIINERPVGSDADQSAPAQEPPPVTRSKPAGKPAARRA